MERRDQADDGRFAGARRAHQRGHRAGLRFEADLVQHRLAGVVFEDHVVESHVAPNRHRWPRLRCGSSSSGFSRNTSCVRSRPASASVNLRADSDHLEHRRHQKGQEHRERHEVAQRHTCRQNLARADVHHGAAHDAHQHRSRKAHQRDRGQASSARCPAGAPRRPRTRAPPAPRRGIPSPRARRPAIR